MFCCFSGGGPAAARQTVREQQPVREEATPALPAQQPSQQDAAPAAPQPVQDGSNQQALPSRESVLTQLSQMLAGVPAAGARSNDLWANLQKGADSLVGALAITAASFYIFTSSRRFCKVVPNSASPQCAALRKSGWELCHSAEAPSAAQVASSRTPSYFQVPANAPASHARAVPPDLQLLHQCGCQAFFTLPLYQGQTVVGALLLAHTDPIPCLGEHQWLAAYLPLLSLYLAETSALRLVNFTERIQTAVGLNQLAWIVSSELDSWFEWCHPEDTEARLVLLAPDQTAAMVLSRSVGTLRAFDPVNSIDVLVASGVRSSGSAHPATRRSSTSMDPDMMSAALRRDSSFASRAIPSVAGVAAAGGKQHTEEGLLGTHMSLSNTLTRRCLAEGSKLLFVADVMAALKKYGEPWKDVFMEQARVTNPTWVVAAPIAHCGRHLGAILWLSSSRLNPNMLAQSAKASVPLLLHTVARQMIHLIQQVSTAAGGAGDDPTVFWSQLLAMPHLNVLSGTNPTATGLANGATGMTGVGCTGTGHMGLGLDTSDLGASSLGGSGLPGFNLGGSGFSDALMGPGGGLMGAGLDGMASRQLRYTVMVRSDSVSTSALVKAYQTAILQHQRAAAATNGAEVASAYEEIQVIAKAGQGAFGSVYVALWKGLVVAVKVMRQQADGRRAMRTAWELAVTKSVSHPNIVMVYATFTDVVVVKLSKRLIRFVPAATTLADPVVSGSFSGASGVGMSVGGGTGGGSGAAGVGGTGASAEGGAAAGAAAASAPAAPSDSGARCQVIIMEYCNLGPLHHYVAERRYAQQLAQQQQQPQSQPQGANGAHGSVASADAAPQPPTATAAAADGATAASAAAHVALAASNNNPASTTNNNNYPTYGKNSNPSGHGNSNNTHNNSHSGSNANAVGGGGASAAAGGGNNVLSGSSNTPLGCLPASAVTGPVEFSTTLATLLEVASALQYLHSMGFIHCDLKPENVLLKASPGDPRGFTIKVSDFGLSELLTSEGPLMGELGGTVTHIAPEIVTHKRVTKAADAYAFGVVMWELLTGCRLYSDLFTSGREKRVRDKLILAKVAHEGLRPVFPEGTPQEYALLARRCWTADPVLRPSFTEIMSELEAMQRRYCKAVQPVLPGLESLLGGTAPAAAAAGTVPASAAVAAAGGAVGVGGGGPDGGSTGGSATAGGNTAPLPLPQAQRVTQSNQPATRATTDVGMTSSRGTPAAPLATGGATTPHGQHQQQPHQQHQTHPQQQLHPHSVSAAGVPRHERVSNGNVGVGGGGGGGAPHLPYGGGGGGALAGPAMSPLRAASVHSTLQPSPLRQVTTARGSTSPQITGGLGAYGRDPAASAPVEADEMVVDEESGHVAGRG